MNMNKYLTHIAILFVAAAAFSCGSKEDPTPTPTPDPAPKAITLSASAFTPAQAGETLSLTVTAPFRPTLSGVPSWITLQDGTFDKYQITFGLVVAANETYETRSATITVKASMVSDVTFTVTQEGKEKPQPGTESNPLADFFGLGWNMGNQFDGYYNGSWAGELEGYPAECCWQPSDAHKATQATFDGVKAAGFTSVRIPVSWLKMIGDAPDYTIDETWINRVYEVVQYAHNAGLKVIINTHHDENHGVSNDYQWQDIKKAAASSATNTAIKAKIKGVWTNIANRFKDCGDDWLMMEGFNEINDGEWGWSSDFLNNPTKQCNILNEWNQVFVDAVRATGGNNATRWLGVPTYAANPEYVKYFTLPDDPAKKTAISVHFYDPSAYTIGKEQYSDWGHTGASDKKADGGDEDHVKEVFSNLFAGYVSNGIPVYIGEYGCSMRSKSDSRAWAFFMYYLEYVVKAARTYELPCFLWDNGGESSGQEQHGYIHHGTGNYIGSSKEPIGVMVKAWFDTDSGYTLDSVYNSAPKF